MKANTRFSLYFDKSNIALALLAIMIAGFLLSPAICSIAVIVFGINSLRDVHPKNWFRHTWWLLGLVWIFFYAITWFYSDDKAYWSTRLQVKLAFLLLPLAFALLPRFTKRQINFITLSIGLLLLAGAVYSISLLLNDYEYYISEYKYAHLFPTPVRNDYIRFSLSIALFFVWSFYAFPLLENRITKWAIGIIILLLFAYIHILAAKSGLISAYLFLIAWCIYVSIAQKKLIGLITLFLLAATLFAGIRFVPTLKKRFDYIDASWHMLRNNDKSGNYGDINRLQSYNVALKLIKKNPWLGVGVGNMEKAMDNGYETWYPEVIPENRLLPHNQFLIVSLGCGIPGLVALLVWLFYALTQLRKNRESFFFFMTWLLLIIQLLIEPAFEIQFGVFVFLFFFLLQWHTLPSKSKQPAI